MLCEQLLEVLIVSELLSEVLPILKREVHSAAVQYVIDEGAVVLLCRAAVRELGEEAFLEGCVQRAFNR